MVGKETKTDGASRQNSKSKKFGRKKSAAGARRPDGGAGFDNVDVFDVEPSLRDKPGLSLRHFWWENLREATFHYVQAGRVGVHQNQRTCQSRFVWRGVDFDRVRVARAAARRFWVRVVFMVVVFQALNRS